MYIILFAIAIAIATFIENDFGTSSAQKVVFKARWFELLLLLFGISIIVNIFRFRMIQQKKWAILTFHAAIIVILIGAAVTRYFGYEGMMHIREGSASNEIQSSETHLLFEAEQNGNVYRFDEQVLFATLGRNKFKESYQIGSEVLNVELEEFIPNPTKALETVDDGMPTLKVVIAGPGGREEYYLVQNAPQRLNGAIFNFARRPMPGAINLMYRNDSLLVNLPTPMSVMQMATQRRDSLMPGVTYPLMVRSLYSNDRVNFVVSEFNPSARILWSSTDPKMRNESVAGLQLKLSTGNDVQTAFVIGGKGRQGVPVKVPVGDLNVAVAYGTKRIDLPFSIALRDFIMERYPGTNSASSYASEVTLRDARNGLSTEYRIFMNNILNYDGYRFFQSSYDRDELGTVLSVNHDFWGTWISYFGYALLTIGMILTLFSRKSRFAGLARALRKARGKRGAMSAATALLALVLMAPGQLSANAIIEDELRQINAEHAREFGRLIVQDHKGRMKPMNTMASEVLRKVARKEVMYGQTADQVFLGMLIYPQDWARVPLIKLGKDERIYEILGVSGSHAAFDDFFNERGEYVLRDHVRRAHSLESIDRTMFDKEIIKIDERVNICNLVFAGSLMKIYPVLNDPANTWISPATTRIQRNTNKGDPFANQFFPTYAPTVQSAVESGDWKLANELVDELHAYQQNNGGEVLLPDRKIDAEIWLNDMHVFSKLGKYYGLLGFGFLIMFFAQVFKPKWTLKWPKRIGLALLFMCFALHTVGLGARWYVSGHAPWSNGYESMIYIGWTTILAGLIFARKAAGGLAATTILASTILMVAGLSWLDPEITPLVPVLKSYWLTIHVSLIAGSYGFLMLGAIIGTLNLLLMIFIRQSNRDRLMRTVREMTQISEMTLIGGLMMLSIGTYLGGIWANESWGRYWGWDAKETWALVTILVYAFILHMRFIPKMRGLYAFNVASLFGFASVMMTYWGVNYYLSGLHSYAAGDPVPIPSFVYYTAGSLLVISLLAYWRWRPFRT